MKKLLRNIVYLLLPVKWLTTRAKAKLKRVEDEQSRLNGLTLRLAQSVAGKKEKAQEVCYHNGHTWVTLPGKSIGFSLPIKKRTYCPICGVQRQSWESLIYANEKDNGLLVEAMRDMAEYKKGKENFNKYGKPKGSDKKPGPR